MVWFGLVGFRLENPQTGLGLTGLEPVWAKPVKPKLVYVSIWFGFVGFRFENPQTCLGLTGSALIRPNQLSLNRTVADS